jgi:hypothetical protein
MSAKNFLAIHSIKIGGSFTMNTANTIQNDQPLLQVSHWLVQFLGLLLAIIFLPCPVIMINAGNYIYALVSVIFLGLGIFAFILYGKTEMNEETIIHKSLFGRFQMKWDEVQSIETDQTDDTIVFKGKGKQLAIPGTPFWFGKDKKRMKELYSKQIEQRQITVKYAQSAMFAISKGTR